VVVHLFIHFTKIPRGGIQPVMKTAQVEASEVANLIRFALLNTFVMVSAEVALRG